MECYNAIINYKKHKSIRPPEDFQIKGFVYPIDFDCVISLNLLNQLDILTMDYLLKYNLYSDEQILYLRKTIQQKHLESLPRSKSILITDVKELWFSLKSKPMGSKNLIHINLPQSENVERWQWQFDMHHNYYNDRNVCLEVVAMKF